MLEQYKIGIKLIKCLKITAATTPPQVTSIQYLYNLNIAETNKPYQFSYPFFRPFTNHNNSSVRHWQHL